MDMWPAYINSVRAHLPDPDRKIVCDRFHVMRSRDRANFKTALYVHCGALDLYPATVTH